MHTSVKGEETKSHFLLVVTANLWEFEAASAIEIEEFTVAGVMLAFTKAVGFIMEISFALRVQIQVEIVPALQPLFDPFLIIVSGDYFLRVSFPVAKQ